jgi:signal transduction histidine kinase
VADVQDTARSLEAVSRAVLAVTQHLDVREVLQTIVSSARTLLDAEYAAIGVPDSGDSFGEFVVDGVSDEQWQAIGPLPRRHGVLGVMLREPRPQRLADIRAHPRFWGWPAAHPELRAFLGMPIRDGDQTLGAIFLANKGGGGEFTGDDECLLVILAAHAAIALTNARLYERSRELTIVSERNRIAGELHDAVTQKLFGLRLTVQAAAALVPRDPDRALAELARVQRLASEALGELRAVIVELRPAGLEDGLAAALRKQVDVLDRASAASVRFTAAQVRPLPAEQEEAVLRVAQEALHNALRHGRPGSVEVDLAPYGAGVALEVRDDGAGFDPAAGPAGGTRDSHLGLGSMRERARRAGGTLDLTSAPGAGTTVRLTVPGHRPGGQPWASPGPAADRSAPAAADGSAAGRVP